jgi:nicotinamide-nucleotide amidase
MDAAIVTIGEEILIGQIVDTNSAWIAQQLNQAGVSVRKIVSITDSGDEIKDTINQLLTDYDIVLTTGGLGPTSDDITKQALCELFDCKLTLHTETLEHIKQLFEQRGLPLTELNFRQAEIPSICDVLFNPNGTAPGMWFQVDKKVLISMPGVPFEMKAIVEMGVIPRIRTISSDSFVIHKTVQTFGLPESFLAEKLAVWEQQIPSGISIAYLPSLTSIRLRLSSRGTNRELLVKEIDDQVKQLVQIIPDNIFGFEEDTIPFVVGNLLKKYGLTLTIAESCTGGYISHVLTQIPGSSAYFKGGVVAYSNELKKDLLGVTEASLANYGAVSKQVVEEMAKGARNRFNSDYAIATSGIAGPTGATESKPVGLIWIAISSGDATFSQEFHLGPARERNIIRGSIVALNLLRLELLKK